MRIIFLSSRNQWLRGIFISILMLTVVGYVNSKYIHVFSAMPEVNRYKVRSQLLMDAMNQVGVCSPEGAAQVWANGLRMRSAALQYSVMSQELKKEYEKQLEEGSSNWVTGMSSPWVESYKIVKSEALNSNHHMIEIRFFTVTSVGSAGDYSALLTLVNEGDFWRIIEIDADRELYPYTRFTV